MARRSVAALLSVPTVLAYVGIAACTPTAQHASLGAAAPAALPSSAGASSEYRIGRGDAVEIYVFRLPDLSRTVEVDGAGQIVLPLIGAMPAAGKTVRQLEADITRLLKVKYLQSPEVSVAVKDGVGQRVTVEGAVKRPGVVQARGQATLLRVLAESQGFTDTADQRAILVFRPTEQGRVVMSYDVNAIRVGQAPDPVILGGDTIVVDEFGGKTAWKQFREVLGVAGGGVGVARVLF